METAEQAGWFQRMVKASGMKSACGLLWDMACSIMQDVDADLI